MHLTVNRKKRRVWYHKNLNIIRTLYYILTTNFDRRTMGKCIFNTAMLDIGYSVHSGLNADLLL